MVTRSYQMPFEISIAPLARLIILSGALLSWNSPLPNRAVCFLFRSVVSALIGLGMGFVFAAGITHVLYEASSDQDVNEVLKTTFRLMSYPIGIVTFVAFTQKRKSFYNFMEKWRQLEQSLEEDSDFKPRSLKRYKLVCIITCFTAAGVSTCLAYFDFDHLDEFGWGNDINATKYISYVLSSVALFYAMLMNFFGVLFPTFAYRHLTFSLCKIEDIFLKHFANLQLLSHPEGLQSLSNNYFITDVKNRHENMSSSFFKAQSYKKTTLSTKDAIKHLRKRFEKLDGLVNDAQDLFGSLLFACYAMSFFVACCALYLLLSSLPVSWSPENASSTAPKLLVAFCFIGSFICKVILVTNVCNDLPNQLKKFEKNMSNVMNEQWANLDTEEKELARNFLYHVRLHQWVIAPLKLFTVDTGTVLSMVSLIVTYVIVLLQSSGK